MRKVLGKIYSAFFEFKKQAAFQILQVSTCEKTKSHLLEIKIVGKAQSIYCTAQEIAADDQFIFGFSPQDVRTICYLATSDAYEALLYSEKIKKFFELLRTSQVNGKKTIGIRNTITGQTDIKFLSEFADASCIENLDSKDAYKIGYMAGQEQSLRDFKRFTILTHQEDKRI